ncbi:hypothetical protein L1987_20313 [Smallanthus sonchifolius]|uniref:Uncharacterized protein n=1 Tax=Smallanthus sonchifolius TaxID=185202 RepID=A0ACB9ITB3_9ASTR|nr:hypothetical protein L1987_20313 [Smallanthus sonchifolius]
MVRACELLLYEGELVAHAGELLSYGGEFIVYAGKLLSNEVVLFAYAGILCRPFTRRWNRLRDKLHVEACTFMYSHKLDRQNETGRKECFFFSEVKLLTLGEAKITSMYSPAALADYFYASLSCSMLVGDVAICFIFSTLMLQQVILMLSQVAYKLLHTAYYAAMLAALVDLDLVGFGYTGAFVEDPMQDKHYHMLDLRALAIFLKEERSICTIMILFFASLLL